MKGSPDFLRSDLQVDRQKVLSQIAAEEFDTFDEYLEIIVEFGYMILFSDIIPLAPLIILFFNAFEIRSDMYKLCTNYRRPDFWRKRNIGAWIYILEAMSWLGIFTNLFMIVSSNNSLIDVGEIVGEQGIKTFFVGEHLVVIAILLLKALYKPVLSWVKIFLERRDYNQRHNRWKLLFA